MWDAMEWFDALSLKVEPWDLNKRADAVVVSTAALQICDDLVKNGKMEIIFRTLVPNNFINWQVFKDDAQIIKFMNLQECSKCQINWREECSK
jgi:hypothetical protein